MYILSIIVFIISSSIHLYASYRRNRKLRALTKGFILPSLILLYISKANQTDMVFIFALVFSWLGDLLLIIPGIPTFAAGGVSFGISHILFIISYFKHVDSLKEFIIAIVVVAIIYIIITSIVFKHLVKYLPKSLVPPMFLYLMTNAAMNCSAFSLLLSNHSLAAIIVFVGALSFFISDTNLFFVRFKKEWKEQNHFVVMFTYIIAELLIVIGMINI